MAPKRINFVMGVLTCILAVSVTLTLVCLSQKFFSNISDTPEYIVAAKLVLAGRAQDVYQLDSVSDARHFYFPENNVRRLSVLSPPPALLLLTPFALLPTSWLSFTIWMPIQLISVIGSVWLLLRVYPMHRTARAWVWAAVFLLGPLYECLRIGQISPITLLALSVLAYRQRKFGGNGTLGSQFLSALALNIFILKPQEILTFGMYLLAEKRYRLIVAGLAIVLGLTLISATAMGLNAFSKSLEVFVHMKNNDLFMQPELTPTFRGQLLRIPGMPSLVVSTVAVLAFVAGLVASFVIARRSNLVADKVSIGFAFIIPLGLLTAFLCHTYDLVLLIPALIATVSTCLEEQSKRDQKMLALMILVLLPLVLPLYAEVNYGWLLHGVVVNPFFFSMLGFVALSGWYWLGKTKQAAPALEQSAV